MFMSLSVINDLSDLADKMIIPLPLLIHHYKTCYFYFAFIEENSHL